MQALVAFTAPNSGNDGGTNRKIPPCLRRQWRERLSVRVLDGGRGAALASAKLTEIDGPNAVSRSYYSAYHEALAKRGAPASSASPPGRPFGRRPRCSGPQGVRADGGGTRGGGLNVAERTNYPREVAQMALAHTIGNAVEATYRRSDLFEKRRRMMDEWAKFCDALQVAGEVLPLRRAKACPRAGLFSSSAPSPRSSSSISALQSASATSAAFIFPNCSTLLGIAKSTDGLSEIF